MVGIASFGHVLNDWTDIESDTRSGKGNALAGRSTSARSLLLGATLVVGLVPWVWLPSRAGPLVVLVVEVLLLVLYSAPPVRLKARGWLGAVADAAYAYAVPFLIATLLLGQQNGTRWATGVGLVGAWGLLIGMRGILWHQLGDLEADRRAGIETAASRIGPSRTESLVASLLLPVEVAVSAGLAVGFGPPWLLWLLLGFVVWRLFQVLLLWVPPLDIGSMRGADARVEVLGFEFLNEFVERWLPLAAMVALAVESGVWWFAVGVHFALFSNAARTFLANDVWVIPDALERLAFSRGIREDIRSVTTARLARREAGPPIVGGSSAGRFVFVVCGPISHLLTLRTAVHHLRPLTSLEVWVVTDSRRNELVMEIDGVDRVVDVKTPEALDDHQASIWLKTSLHHHLPDGEWCYLDSDIIAVVPGVEGVFRERHGPIAFASDLTIRENCVDRFSPWAMNCECLGHGAEHSCEHLREALRDRFDLDVPGDWLHWNGGVFVFGPKAHAFLDLWHERAVASFEWPEWRTRDQGALISTAWSLQMEDLPRISPEFNFIADLGNYDLCLDREFGWAHHPEGPWFDPKFLHLYTSDLEDPSWDLGTDVEAIVLRRTRLRLHRWRRGEAKARVRYALHQARSSFQRARSDARWAIQKEVERWIAKARLFPKRLTPRRIYRSIRRRLGLDVSHLPIPGIEEPESRRVSDRPPP